MIFVGLGLTLLLSILLLTRHGNTTLTSEYKVSNISFFSLLFTTGLDGGVISSARIRFIKVLSVASVVLFLVLMLAIAWHVKIGVTEFTGYMTDLTHYFSTLDKFVWPQNSYHEFYLYWWFAWSIMIGQFTAQFVKGIKA